MTTNTVASTLLNGLRVVDCSRGTAGPRTAGLLADYGADVVWVEPPGGDPWRDQLAVEYAVFNRGKRSVEIDVTTPAGQDDLESLLATADVFISSWRPGSAERYGLGYEQLHSRWPGIVYCSITGFGSDGPLRDVPGYEPIVHALVGTMGEQYGFRDGPIFEGLPFASTGASYLASIGVLSALYRRADDGHGRHVETSMLDGAVVYLGMFWGDTDNKPGKKDDYPTGGFLPGGATRMITGYFRCADDGYIGVHTGAVGAFGRLMTTLGLADRVVPSPDGMDVGKPLTDAERQVLEEEIHGIFAAETRDVWVKRLLDADVCGIAVLRPTEVFDEPQARFNATVVKIDDPAIGVVEQVAPPITFASERAWHLRPAPRPGEHTREVLTEARAGRDDAPWLGRGALDDRPLLDGVNILDCGAYYAGPASARHLADFGANVIKLETLAGDMLRGLPRLFQTAQAAKRSISVNLKDPDLVAAREGLIRWADIVHHNMRPGAAERLGIGAEQAQQINPNVIYGHAAGWGPEGPYSLRQSFEPMLSGYVGSAFEAAGQYNPPVLPLGNADPGNGLAGAIGMLLSLLHRRRTGTALRFENPQLNASMTVVGHIVRADDGTVLNADKLDPLQCGFSATERLYETADGWICVVALREPHLVGLGQALGIEILGDQRFASADARREHDYDLYELIGSALAASDTATMLQRLRSAGVPAAVPVPHNNHRYVRDPENRRTRRVGERPHPIDGNVRDLDQFIRVSAARIRPFRLAPELGEHTDEILAMLGYDAATTNALHARNAIRQWPRPS